MVTVAAVPNGRLAISIGSGNGHSRPAAAANGHDGPAMTTGQNGPVAAGQDAVAARLIEIAPILAVPTEAHVFNSLHPQIRSSAPLAGQPGAVVSSEQIDAAMPLGLVLAGLAAALAWQGLRINAWYGTTLGDTPEASGLLSNLSMVADAVAFALPAAARALWHRRWRPMALAAWLVWFTIAPVAVMATVGFLSTNIADSSGERAKMAGQSASLAARIGRLRGEQAALTEFRPAKTIEAEIQGAQPKVDSAVWKSTSGCRDVTIPASGQACADVLRLRQALGLAQRRDTVDADLREAEVDLARLPAVTSADPQAETAVSLVTWISRGRVLISQHGVAMARLVAISLLPQVAGVVFMFAIALLSGALRAILARLVAPLRAHIGRFIRRTSAWRVPTGYPVRGRRSADDPPRPH